MDYLERPQPNKIVLCESDKHKEKSPSIPNYKTFDFFGSKFDHLSYSKNLCKYSQI